MLRLILVVVLLAAPTFSNAERRRAYYRKTTTTSTAAPIVEETSSSEAKYHDSAGEGLYTVGDSFTIGGGFSSSTPRDNIAKGSAFKPVTSSGDKLTSFSEYGYGGTQISDHNDSGSDEDYGINLKNIKPLKSSSSSSSFKPSGSFDFLNTDYLKSPSDSKTKTSYTNKFSISHPNPTKSSLTGKVDHLDDSTEYEIYSSLKSANSYKTSLNNLGLSKNLPYEAISGSSLNFDGKVKKLSSFSFDDSALASYTSNKNKKNKLSLDDDSFGGGSSFGLSNNFGVGKLDNPFSSGGKFTNPYGFGEPPLVKSAVSTLKHFGAGLLGAGIAAKGQIENFLNAEHSFRNEPIRTTHFLDGHPGKKGQYNQFLKSQEDEQFEKEALKAQIEYLKAQASKRPVAEVRRPPGPPPSAKINSGPPRGRPVRRIPQLAPLGAKQSRPPVRIPHYNDRPYSISFKL
ncbi:uncharacterized protein LOC134208541 isoform X5 [Armigeres subalbatus]|uniref:uncharacterized protein LOC134208541 isoform X5 n=1 Tax=Armigeres subalbatus TaxID=124917 RepID=UPI002ED3EED6